MRPDSISVVVCTFNRAASLSLTLDSVLRAAEAAAVPVEVVVVDNNSHDHTAAVVAAVAAEAKVPVKCGHEPRQGLAFARNAGVARAGGAVVAFTDDDVTVAPDWLAQMAEAFARTGAAAIGGRILPAWGGPVPRWLTQPFHRHFALLDLGPEPRRLDAADVWGANLAVRRDMLLRHGPFPTHLGHRGTTLGAGEETAVLARLIAAGEAVQYWPGCVVHHRIPAERMRRRYVLRHEWSRGGQEARAEAAAGVPRWLWRMLIERGAAALAPGAGQLRRQARFAYWLGFAAGKLTRDQDAPPTPGGGGPVAAAETALAETGVADTGK